MKDLKFALRLLNKHRLFSLAIIITMALAIGVNTTAFSVLDALLLRPVPVKNPDRLVQLHMSVRQDGGAQSWMSWSYPDYLDYKAGTGDVFTGMALYWNYSSLLGTGNAVSRIGSASVTRDFFRVMGIKPILGHTFESSSDKSSSHAPLYQVVISKRFWHSHFDSARDVIGKTMMLNHHRFMVIGVVDAEPVFKALNSSADLWMTLGTKAGCSLDKRGEHCERAFARLKPDVNLDAAQQALNIVNSQLTSKYPKTNGHERAVAHGAARLYGLIGMNRGKMLLIALSLMGVAGAILLIACANIANLFLARGARRVREIAVRMTLGANATMIARQLLVEALVLSIIGAAAGLLTGWFGISYIGNLPAFTSLGIALDWRVGLFTVLVALAAGLLFSLAPLWPVLKMDLFSRLTVISDTLTGRQSRVRDGLVVLQVALCLALLVCAGLFIRTLNNAYNTDLGFPAGHVLVASVDFPGSKPPSDIELQRVRNRVGDMSGVQDVGFITSAPLAGGRMQLTELHIPGFSTKQIADFATAADGYFAALGTPLLHGDRLNAFAPGDTSVVMVNEAFVRKYWPHGWTPGKRLRVGNESFTVAGVVGNIHHNTVSDAAVPRVYWRFPRWAGPYLNMVVRTRDSAVNHEAAIRQAVHELYPQAPAPAVYAVLDHVQSRLAPISQVALFLAAFGAVALSLAVVGIYALLAYLVTQRTAEIGLRQAVGADYWDIVALFVRKSALLVTIGVAIGLGVAVAVMRTLQHFLYGVRPTDPPTLIGAVIVFSVIAGIATYIPARRAAKLDPAAAILE